jgi:sn-glycerol 3-phosphate transport system substrate-binding protein
MRRVPLVATLAVTLLAAACGSGSKSSSDSTTPPTASTGTTATGSATTGSATTAPGPTTTAVPADKLPPCPVDALASVTAPVEITFWHEMAADNERALQQITDAYNAGQTKVKVTLVNQTGYEQAIDKYRTSSKGDRPEIVQLPEYTLQLLADSKTIVPTQSCVNAEHYDLSDYVDRMIAYYTIGGALQAMPFNTSVPVLYYNRKAFVAAGLDPDKPPVTLADLRAASEKLVSSKAATYGVALDSGLDSGGGWYIEQFMAMADQLYADNGNGRQARATKVLFDQGAADYLTILQKMVADKLAVNVGENPQDIADLLKIADQNEPAAMAIHTSAALASALNVLKTGTYPNVHAEDLGIGPMPSPTTGGNPVGGGASLWIVKDKTPQQTAAAWDFVKYLTSPAVQSTWAAATGYVPVRTSAADLDPIKTTYTTDPRFKVAYDSLTGKTLDQASAGPVLGPLREVRKRTAQAVQAILSGSDVNNELKSAASDADALIADYAKRTGTGG